LMEGNQTSHFRWEVNGSLTPQSGRGFCQTETTQAPYNTPAGVRMIIQLKISHDVKIVVHVFFVSF
jgi:hypothetical protein